MASSATGGGSGELKEQILTVQREITSRQATLDKLHQQLPVSPDLQFFFGDKCPFTARAAPSVACTELSIFSRLTQLEIYKDKSNREQYMKTPGADECGGVPFFYNKVTGESVCGVTDCDRLKAWATGSK
jgi:hypothetical protein